MTGTIRPSPNPSGAGDHQSGTAGDDGARANARDKTAGEQVGGEHDAGHRRERKAGLQCGEMSRALGEQAEHEDQDPILRDERGYTAARM